MLVELEEVSAGDEFRMGKTADGMFEGGETSFFTLLVTITK